VVECLPRKHKALSSKPSNNKKKFLGLGSVKDPVLCFWVAVNPELVEVMQRQSRIEEFSRYLSGEKKP
jgi:hypothetical protein